MTDTSTVRAPDARAVPRERARRSFDRWTLALVGSWLVVRFLYFWLGDVRFDTDSLEFAYQFVHRDLLADDLWTSVWHLHAQPPLFNLFLGAVLQLPGSARAWFEASFHVIGLGLALLVDRLARGLGAGRALAAAAAILLTATPAAVFYEHYLFYTLPVAALLCAAVLTLHRYLGTARTAWGVAFFSAVTALALIRATYHLAWVAAAVAFAAWALRGRVPLRAVLAAALPALLVPGLYVKNLVQFDSFSASSWMGMNLARLTLGQADPDELQRLVDDGVVSERALLYPFEDLDTFGVDHAPTGVATLDRRWKGSAGDPNLNNLDYVEISKQYQRDALAYLRRHPREYGATVLAALRLYLLPVTYNPHVGNNLLEMYDFTKFTWRLVDLQPVPYEDVRAFFPTRDTRRFAPGWRHVSLAAVATYGIAVVAWPVWLVRTRRRPRGPGLPDRATRLTLGFASATVGFALVASTMLELGENNRFRFETDPLVWAMAAAFVALRLRPRPAA